LAGNEKNLILCGDTQYILQKFNIHLYTLSLI